MNKIEIKSLAKEIVKSLNKSKENLDSLKLFSLVFEKKPVVLNLLSNPLIPLEKREEIFIKAMEMAETTEISKVVLLSFFREYNLNLLKQIIPEIEKEFLKVEGILPVNIFLPMDFAEDIKERIVLYLEKKFGKKIKANFIINPKILGGFEAISESYHYVASIKRFLKSFKFKEEKWQ